MFRNELLEKKVRRLEETVLTLQDEVKRLKEFEYLETNNDLPITSLSGYTPCYTYTIGPPGHTYRAIKVHDLLSMILNYLDLKIEYHKETLELVKKEKESK